MTSPEMHTLTGAYALDALSEHERARFERHMAECSACAQEVRELRATATKLGEATAEQPPPELKQRVLSEVSATRQASPVTRGRASWKPLGGGGVPRWAMAVAVAAAVLGLALAGVFGGIALRTQDQLNAAQQRIEQLEERYGALGKLLAADDTRIAHATSSVGGSAMVVYSPSLGMMMFMAQGLPEQQASSDYQLWLLTPAGAEPAPVLPEVGEGATVLILENARPADRLGLTIEPEGGSRQPSMEPILALDVSV